MDASPNPARDAHPAGTPAAPARGGSIEPNASTARKQAAQAPRETTRNEAPSERYELRDPFNEVVYHSKRFDEMAAKAEQLGSNRFTAIDPAGRRTLVHQVDGHWARDARRSVHGPETQPLAATPASPPGKQAAPPPHPKAPEAGQNTQTPDPAEARRHAQAERAAHLAQLEAALNERYLIKHAPLKAGDISLGQTEYRFRGDTSRVAFTESTLKLATDTNSPSVARSMVDVAEARGWKALRVTGNEEFRRMVWLEASVRGVKTVGYEPNPADQERLQREREARQINRIEPARGEPAAVATNPAEKASARGSGGRKAVLAAIEAILVAKRVPDKQRAAVMAAASEKLAQRIRDGQVPKVKVYDSTAPSQRAARAPVMDVRQTRDRGVSQPTR